MTGEQQFEMDVTLHDANQRSVVSAGTVEFQLIEGVRVDPDHVRYTTLCSTTETVRRESYAWRSDQQWHVLTLRGHFDPPCAPIQEGHDLRGEVTLVTSDGHRLTGLATLPESLGEEARAHVAAARVQADADAHARTSARARERIVQQLPGLASALRAIPEPATMSDSAACQESEVRSRSVATIDYALLSAYSNAGPTGERMPQPSRDEIAFSWISDDAFWFAAVGLRDAIEISNAPPETDLLRVIRAQQRTMPAGRSTATGEAPHFNGGSFDGVMFLLDRHEARVLCHVRFHAESSTALRVRRRADPHEVAAHDFREHFFDALSAAQRSIWPESD